MNGTGNYTQGDVITINIPTGQNLAMAPSESYLKFKVAFLSAAASNAWRWGTGGAHTLFSRIRIYHGSNLLQDINEYGLLAKMLTDLIVPDDAVKGKYNAFSGMRSDLVYTTAAAFAANTRASAINPASGEQITGLLALADITGDIGLQGAAGTLSNWYCLNLMCLIGSLCPQFYLPLWEMSGSPLRVELQLQDQPYRAISQLSATTSFTLSSVEYIAQMIELSDEAISLIRNRSGGEIKFPYQDFRQTSNSYSLTQNASVQVQMLLPFKFSSIKSIFIAVRDRGQGANGGYFPTSSITQGITDYQFRIGAKVMPSRPVATLQEMYIELMKAISSLADASHQPRINKLTYQQITSVISNDGGTALLVSSVNEGQFFIGIDVEGYAGASKDGFYSGLNTNTDDIFFIGNFLNTSANLTTRFDTFCMFDAVFNIQNGIAYQSF
jgi:hypothetical protein